MDLGKESKYELPPAQAAFDNTKMYVWIKGLESKINNLIREVDILKNDLVKRNNNLSRDLKTTNNDVLELKHEQDKTVQKMDLIIKELKQTAGAEEVTTIKKYLEYWNPLNFVTEKDLDRAIEGRISLKNAAKDKEVVKSAVKDKGK